MMLIVPTLLLPKEETFRSKALVGMSDEEPWSEYRTVTVTVMRTYNDFHKTGTDRITQGGSEQYISFWQGHCKEANFPNPLLMCLSITLSSNDFKRG